jgi:hypothetical protein
MVVHNVVDVTTEGRLPNADTTRGRRFMWTVSSLKFILISFCNKVWFYWKEQRILQKKMWYDRRDTVGCKYFEDIPVNVRHTFKGYEGKWW